LVINYNSQTPPRLAELIAEARIPAIWINDKREADCVFPDDFGAAKSATERLIAEGHTRIAYAGWTPGPHYSMVDRLAGYQAAMAERGLTENIALLEQTPATVLFSTQEPPTAVLCYSPDTLATVWEANRSVKLVVIHAEPYTTLEHAFDTWLLPDYTLGAAAVELLVQKIALPQGLCTPRALPLSFHKGDKQ
jgi:LacI family transcriptional regulator